MAEEAESGGALEGFEPATANSENRNNDTQNHPAQFFVGGIDEAITEQNLRDYFLTYGELDLLILKRADPPKKPFAFVAFKDKQNAEAVLDNYANNKIRADDGQDYWIDVRWCRLRSLMRWLLSCSR